MIAVISDLHFEEEASDVVRGHGRVPDLVFRRNLDPKAYENFVTEMAWQVERRKVRDFELVIAGDLFDLNRTTLWQNDSLRPYGDFSDISPAGEEKVLSIMQAIAAEPPVEQALATFRLLSRGRYRDTDSGKERDFPAKNIRIRYLPGNHDRLCNATKAIRKRVSDLVGLDGNARFEHFYLSKDHAALVRHGHEYDANNFALDPGKLKTVPLSLPDKYYERANFGDFVTIDVAARLPVLFRRHYGDAEILKKPVMRDLYVRLLQFDDVRPQSALLDYLLDTSHADYSAEDAWELLVPVIQDLLEELQDNKFFHHWVGARSSLVAPAELAMARGLLKMGGWRNRAAREVARKVARHMLGGGPEQPELVAMREQMVLKRKVRLVVAGHTHEPKVCLIGSDPESDRFYVNTGTWRNRIPATPDGRTFGRLKALTYIVLYLTKEEDPKARNKGGTLDYWTGYTRQFA